MKLSEAASGIPSQALTFMINDKFYNSSTAGHRGWAKYRDSENFKGLLYIGVYIAPVPLPGIFPRAAGLYGRT
jgi:hypothetical protein